MIHLPMYRRAFPKMEAQEKAPNSWQSQWTHLPRLKGRLMRIGKRLRVMPIE